MHILVIPSWYHSSFNPQKGTFFMDQAECLSRHVDKVSVVAPVLISIKEITINNIFKFGKKNLKKNNFHEYIYPVLAIPFCNKINTLIQFYCGKIILKKYVKDHGVPDIVHLQSSLSGMLALWFKKKYGVSFIVTEHWSGFINNKASKAQKLLSKEVFLESKKNIAVSNYFSSLLKRQFNCNFNVVPNVVDINFFKPSKNKFKTFTFLQVASLNDNKNQEMLIAAFCIFVKKYKSELIIIGQGEKLNMLSRLIKQFKLENSVKLLGQKNRDIVKDYMQKSHALLITSYIETFGVVAIEAMACGIPVISTRCGGPEEIIDKHNGVLCEISKDSIYESMVKCYESKWDSIKIRSKVESNYSTNAISSKILKLINL